VEKKQGCLTGGTVKRWDVSTPSLAALSSRGNSNSAGPSGPKGGCGEMNEKTKNFQPKELTIGGGKMGGSEEECHAGGL